MVAVKFCELPVPTDALVGDTETEIGGGGAPLEDLNAAIAAPQLSIAESVAVAAANPWEAWI
jgi:hypothetical protein